MPNPVKSFGYTKYHSWSGPRPTKSPINSEIQLPEDLHLIEKTIQEILKDYTETILEIRKMPTFHEVINKPIIYKFFIDFTNNRKKTKRAVVLRRRPLPSILKYRDHW